MAAELRSIAQASTSELGRALAMSDLPLVVWELPAGVARIVNRPMEELLGLPRDRLLGHEATDLASPRDAIETALAALASGAVDRVRSKRLIRRPDGEEVPVRVWSRAVDVDGHRGAVSLFVPLADAARFGRDPSAPWRDLTPLVVGFADSKWHIEGVSADVRDIVGSEPTDLVGRSLLEMIHPDDLGDARIGGGEPSTSEDLPCRVRVQRLDGTWAEVGLLSAAVGEEGSGGVVFALVRSPDLTPGSSDDRVAELELRLRRIGAEVRAAGVLEGVGDLPAPSDLPQLGELTSRQWEIMSRLLRGDRVTTIAADLYLSRSTVRNHLSSIFQKFGVHSQSELLDLLRHGG